MGHLTVTARNEDEVDENELLDKVSKVSSTTYNFKEKQTLGQDAPPTPVGSNHKKINPKAELPNMDEREKFWNSEESKEKQRLASDKDRKKSEAKQLDMERRTREEKESQLREVAIKERERKISQIKEKEARVDGIKIEDKKKWEEQQIEDAKDEESRQKRAQELRRQRSEEAKQLIGQRSTEARAVFERHSSQGQMNFKKQQTSSSNIISVVEEPESKPVAVSPTPAPAPKEDAINANEVSTEDNIVPPPDSFGNDDNRVNEIQQQPPDVTGAASTHHQPDLIQDVAAKQGPDITSSAIASEETKNE